MTATVLQTSLNTVSTSTCHASHNRREDWMQCCSAALGFDWVDTFQDGDDSDGSDGVEIVNLVEDLDDGTMGLNAAPTPAETPFPHDPWMEHALRIQGDLRRMTEWIRDKRSAFVSLDMKEDEASLIQTTITSFAATTASELETLRKMISMDSKDIGSHRNGVVQLLLTELQEQIARPFGVMQKQRTRTAVQLWQNPLQCVLYQPSRIPTTPSQQSRMLQFFDEETDETRDQRFLPRRAMGDDEDDFSAMYCLPENDASQTCPDFLSTISENKRRGAQSRIVPEFDGFSIAQASAQTKPTQPKPTWNATPHATIIPYEPPASTMTEDESQRHMAEELAQEAALLTVSAQNDLDSVQKVEQRMVEITTLISQFANLVTEQQEDIWQIQESSQATKENIAKGQENLVKAAERTKRSRHYMAWSIFTMSLVLLFFHTLKS